MSPLFSILSPYLREERPPHNMELQLLPDDDLMDVWEQAQRAVWMMDEKGWDSAGAMHYCDILLWEMQRRQVNRPLGAFFGEGCSPVVSTGETSRIVTIQI